MDYAIALAIVIVGVYAAAAIRIANENERFAVFALGRFAGFKGPGLVLSLPGGGSRLIRVALGAEGEIQSNELVLVAGHAVPYIGSNEVRAGLKVRVTGFAASGIEVQPVEPRFVVCEKCGHRNPI